MDKGTELKGKIGHVNKELEVSIKEHEALATFNYIATRCQEEDSYIIKFPLGIEKGRTFAYEMEKAHKVMKQALTEKQDLEKFTKLVVEKRVDIHLLRNCINCFQDSLYAYNKEIEKRHNKWSGYQIAPLNFYQLTEEEFAFIKEMIAKYEKRI